LAPDQLASSCRDDAPAKTDRFTHHTSDPAKIHTLQSHPTNHPTMVKHYYANKHAHQNGDHAVHREDCDRLPPPDHRLDLGLHYAPETAVSKAKLHNPQASPCAHCSPESPGN